MLIEDSFRVPLSVDEAWRLLLDLERIAPCMPGAQLQEVEGDEYRGIVKVKVGPITAQYKGSARFEEVDEGARRALIAANGRDTRGQGNASAAVKVSLAEEGDGTRVQIETDLSITGKVAQFGRGVLADVSSKLLAQFVDNLERDVLAAREVDLTGEEARAEEAPGGAAHTAALAGASGDGATREAGAASGNGAGGVRRIEGPEAEPVDLLAVGGTPVLQRVAPVIALVVLVLVVRAWRRRRRRRRA